MGSNMETTADELEEVQVIEFDEEDVGSDCSGHELAFDPSKDLWVTVTRNCHVENREDDNWSWKDELDQEQEQAESIRDQLSSRGMEAWQELISLPKMVCLPVVTHPRVLQVLHPFVTPMKKTYSILAQLTRMILSFF